MFALPTRPSFRPARPRWRKKLPSCAVPFALSYQAPCQASFPPLPLGLILLIAPWRPQLSCLLPDWRGRGVTQPASEMWIADCTLNSMHRCFFIVALQVYLSTVMKTCNEHTICAWEQLVSEITEALPRQYVFFPKSIFLPAIGCRRRRPSPPAPPPSSALPVSSLPRSSVCV